MAKSTTKENGTQGKDTQTDSTSELGQLREILFGESQRHLFHAIEQLEQRFVAQMEALKAQADKNHQTLSSSLASLETQFNEKLAVLSKQSTDRSDELAQTFSTTCASLSSEIEMSDTSSKEEVESLHSRLEKEIRNITELQNNQHNQALAKLSEMNKELNSSKTDRKTLAKLLTTVATNLEEDPQGE